MIIWVIGRAQLKTEEIAIVDLLKKENIEKLV